MRIKDLLTKEQYTELKKQYAAIVKNKEITFFEFCTNTYKLKPSHSSSIKKNKKNIL